MPSTGAATKVKDPEYSNWLKVSLALYYLTDGLHSYIQGEVDAMHQFLLQKLYRGSGVAKPQCSSCKSKDVKQIRNTYAWKFKSSCPSHLCDTWLAELLTLHTNPTSNKIYWDNCDVTAWPFVPWECAKLYMPRGQLPANTGPVKCDSQALLTLMANCKYFHGKLSPAGLRLTHMVSKIRNSVMHSEEMRLSDGVSKSFIQDIISLLEDPTHLKSLEECKVAVNEINKIVNDSIDVFFNVELEMIALMTAVNAVRQDMGKQEQGTLGSVESLREEYIQLKEEMRTKIDTVESRVGIVENRQDTMDYKVNTIERGIESVKEQTDTAFQSLKSVVEKTQQQQVELSQAISTSVAPLGVRVEAVEEKLTNLQESGHRIVENIASKEEKDKVEATTYSLVNKKRDCNENAGISCEDIALEMPQGMEGKICIIKCYADLKLALEKDIGMDIAKGLFKKEKHKDVLEEIAKAGKRRHCIDQLLKRVLQLEASDLKIFFDLLKRMCRERAKQLAEIKVTEKDRENFIQVSESVKMAPHRRQDGLKFEQLDVEFFKCYFQDIPEKVDKRADVLLSQFHISICEHSQMIKTNDPEKKIHALLEKIQSCHFDSDMEVKSMLGSKLHQKWQRFKVDGSRQGLENQGIWHYVQERIHSSKEYLIKLFRELGIYFMQAIRGSLVLKFVTLDNFDVKLLTPEAVKTKVWDMIKTLCPEYQDVFNEPVHLTIFFKPLSNTDSGEIHLYLEARKEKEEFSCMKLGSHDKQYFLEEMNSASLNNWMLNTLQLDEDTKAKLVDLVSLKDMSRRNKMKILLNIVESLGNGYELLEKYCEEHDTFLYDKVFKKHRHVKVEENPDLAQQYEFSEEGLQRLSSTWIDFTVDSKEKDKVEDVSDSLIDEKHARQLEKEDADSSHKSSQSTKEKMGERKKEDGAHHGLYLGESADIDKVVDKYQRNEERRIILIGKTGSGKSTIGNALLGDHIFKNEGVLMRSNTTHCQVGRRTRKDGKDLVVLDTTGLMDTKRRQEEIIEELCKCTAITAPGPHAFCLVIRSDERFTQENIDTLDEFCDFFGAEIYKYVIIVFTHKASMSKSATTDDYLSALPTEFVTKFLKFGGKKIAIESTAAKKELKKQINELFKLIEEIIERNDGGYYSEEKFKAAEEAFRKRIPKMQQEVEKLFEGEKKSLEDEYLENAKRFEERENILIKKHQEEKDKLMQEQQLKEEDKLVKDAGAAYINNLEIIRMLSGF